MDTTKPHDIFLKNINEYSINGKTFSIENLQNKSKDEKSVGNYFISSIIFFIIFVIS